MLRFHLCRDDACELIRGSHPLFAAFGPQEQSMIRLFVQSTISSNRRIHALIGQTYQMTQSSRSNILASKQPLPQICFQK